VVVETRREASAAVREFTATGERERAETKRRGATAPLRGSHGGRPRNSQECLIVCFAL
jgi:hypothetical protein